MKLQMVNITKQYGKKMALNGFSSVMTQGIYGILGPNGAGKSTLMQILTGNLSATSGTILWDGQDIKELGDAFFEKIGYVPQVLAVYPDFTANQYLSYIGALKGMGKAEVKEACSRILEWVELKDVADKKIRTFSEGMKRRLLLGQGILGNPKILILDEPTAGLDPGQRIAVRNLIAEIAADKIVIVATHIVADVETVAKEVILLGNGKIIAQKSVKELAAELGEQNKNGKSQNLGLEDIYLYYFGSEQV
uniref:ATP-binding cassette domain-containing protein n=1 Tax=Agathobacter sp. TaxID=2021311 RepID=UPI0040564A85